MILFLDYEREKEEFDKEKIILSAKNERLQKELENIKIDMNQVQNSLDIKLKGEIEKMRFKYLEDFIQIQSLIKRIFLTWGSDSYKMPNISITGDNSNEILQIIKESLNELSKQLDVQVTGVKKEIEKKFISVFNIM